jgi:hypothetical protein
MAPSLHAPAPKLQAEDLVESMAGNVKKGEIPEKFILPEEHRPAFALTRCSDEIPVVDMAGLDASDAAARQQTLDTIHKACLEWGFFQVILNRCCS